MTQPKAKKIPKTLTKHNHERIDNYYWLNDREDSEVIDYLNAENAYTKAKLKPTEALQKELFDEITAKIVKDDSSVPYEMNGIGIMHVMKMGRIILFIVVKRGRLNLLR